MNDEVRQSRPAKVRRLSWQNGVRRFPARVTTGAVYRLVDLDVLTARRALQLACTVVA